MSVIQRQAVDLTSVQTVGGAKTFSADTTLQGEVFQVNTGTPGATLTVANTDTQIQFLTPSVDCTLTLNNTHVAGKVYKIYNLSTTKFIKVVANDATVVRTIFPSTNAEFVSTIASPTGQASWLVLGTAGSEWIAYTPTYDANWGTVTGTDFKYRRQGNSIVGIGYFIAGTAVNAGLATFTLPSVMGSQLNIDTTVIDANNKLALGRYDSGNAAATKIYAGQGGLISFTNVAPGDSTKVYLVNQYGNATSLANPTPFAAMADASGDGFFVQFHIPISGWTNSKG